MKATRTPLFGALLAAALALGCAAQAATHAKRQAKEAASASTTAEKHAAAKAPAGDAALGKKLMLAKCATCHNKDGHGNPVMAKLFKVPPQNMNWASPQNVKKSDAELKSIITHGNGKMPSFKGKLQDADIANVIAFIRTVQKASGK